jgi:hypothetical protein
MEDTLLGNTTKNGRIGETAILHRLVQLGYEVLLPWSQDSGYDLAYYIEKEEQWEELAFGRKRRVDTEVELIGLEYIVLTQRKFIWFPYGMHQMHL